MAKLLIVEDDAALAEGLADSLEMHGHKVEIAYNGVDGLHLLELSGFDLAIIDWHLPQMSGLDICFKYRHAGGRIPILMLTNRSTVVDKTTGLDAGADDYLAKPFDLAEFGARVRALLRRSSGLFQGDRKVGQIQLNYENSSVTVGEREIVRLVPREFELLEFLLRHPDTFFPAEQLLRHVWDSDAEVGYEALRTCVSRLRSKIDQPGLPSIIETSKGWGYKISEYYLKESAGS